MTTQTVEKTAVKQPSDFAQKLQKLRELYADAGDISKDRAGERDPLHRVRGIRRFGERKDRKCRPYRRPPG